MEGVAVVAPGATGARATTHDAAGREFGWVVCQGSGKLQLGAQIEPSAFADNEKQWRVDDVGLAGRL